MARRRNNKTTRAQPAAPPEMAELAAISGEDIGAAFADELRVASDSILQARGGGDVAIYESVMRDDQVYSTFQQRRLAVVSREWYVEPGGDAPNDKSAAEDLEDQLNGIEFDSVTYKMLTGIFTGRSIGELLLRAEGTRIVLDDIRVRNARRFRFDRDNRLRLVTRSNLSGVVMPENKFWIFRAPSNDDDDPYSIGLGHYCYWPVWFKRNVLRFWPLFLQRFAGPTPIAKIPPGTKAEDRNKVLRMLDDLTIGGKLVIPSNVLLEFMQALRSSGGDYFLFCKYMDAAIAKIVLSQTMTTDDGSSKSQAEVHADVKLEVIKSDADLVCSSFNHGPAKWLIGWNYPGAATPRVWRRVVSDVDLNAQAERDVNILSLGYEPTQGYIDSTYGSGFVKRVQAPRTGVDFAEPIGQVADAVDRIISDWRPLMAPELEAVEALIAKADSYDEAKRVLGAFAEREPEALAESLARAMFAGRIAGNLDAELDGNGN